MYKRKQRSCQTTSANNPRARRLKPGMRLPDTAGLSITVVLVATAYIHCLQQLAGLA